MIYLPDGAQMKAADGYTIEKKSVSSLELMEHAAMCCVKKLTERPIDLSDILIVCGSGNNGGDGFAIGSILKEMGYKVTVHLAGNPEHLTEECRFQKGRFLEAGGHFCDEYPEAEYSIIIDALFGVGLSRKVEGAYETLIGRMNEAGGFKFAVDIPSGVSADTGCILGTAFEADLTVTFQAAKRGLFMYPGKEYAGDIITVDIGICTEPFAHDPEVVYTLARDEYQAMLPERRADSNKGTYGKLLIIAGSKGMSGAAYLNALAAYRTGAGLVHIYTEKDNRVILQTLLPEAVISTYKNYSEAEVLELLQWADAVCIGSGMGMSETSGKILETVLDHVKVPCVMDADGLNLMASHPEYVERLKKGAFVLTPHMKEMSRLAGRSVEDIRRNRFHMVHDFVEQYRAVCVLKDSRTLVAAPGERTYLNLSGNSAMAKAGAGDVLAGMIAGLLSQGLSGVRASVLGVYLHGRCGDMARERKGRYSVLATDLADTISDAFREQEVGER